jgi:hypothetical protein
MPSPPSHPSPPHRLPKAVLLLLVGFASTLSAEPSRLALAPETGRLGLALDEESLGEYLALAPDLAPRLLEVAEGELVRLAEFPIAPGERAEVELRRFSVYAPDAQIWVVGRRGTLREVPRSPLVFFGGADVADGERRVQLAVDPRSGVLSAVAFSLGGSVELRALGTTDATLNAAGSPPPGGPRSPSPTYLLAPVASFLPRNAVGAPQELTAECAEADLAAAQQAPRTPPHESASPAWIAAVGAAALPSLHTATIAVETDNEFMQLKFGNDTTAATNYLANLFANMNVAYERDLNLRLLQGTTFLRPSTTADPYPSTSLTSTVNKLYEFGNYWSANYRGVTRALAMMLSGKSPSTNSASGVAWVGGVCSSSQGYSFTQVFRFAADTSANDTRIVAHELGHNFGSPHTHCYSPPIDTCYSGESGCYTGATGCPASSTINGVANVRGTVMSYCHLLGTCAASTVFHPRTVDVITNHVTPRINSCVFPVGPAITSVAPLQGRTSGGTAVTIRGSGFVAGATVTFGGAAATSVVVVNSSTITAVTPARVTGAVSVAVTNPGGASASRANAYFYADPTPALDFYTLAPCRVFDTRNANGPQGGPALAANGTRVFGLTGVCGIPADAQAVSVNVTIADPTTQGSVNAYPGNAFPLGTSTAPFPPGLTRATNAVLRLSTNGDGTLGFHNTAGAAAHVIVDVNGYFR